MDLPRISVVVPAYNIAQWLPRSLDSLLAQTYPNLEIVVVDDGSGDDTRAVAQDYAARFDNVRLICKENGGTTSARLRGVAELSSAYHKSFLSLRDTRQGLFPIRHHLHLLAFLYASALAQHDMVPVRQRSLRERFVSPSPHNNHMTRRYRLETLQIGRKVPQEIVILPYGTVFRHSDYQAQTGSRLNPIHPTELQFYKSRSYAQSESESHTRLAANPIQGTPSRSIQPRY